MGDHPELLRQFFNMSRCSTPLRSVQHDKLLFFLCLPSLTSKKSYLTIEEL